MLNQFLTDFGEPFHLLRSLVPHISWLDVTHFAEGIWQSREIMDEKMPVGWLSGFL